jgi:hypothetical protein
MRLLVILLVILVLFSGSGVYAYDAYGAWSFTPVGLLIIGILLVWVFRRVRS